LLEHNTNKRSVILVHHTVICVTWLTGGGARSVTAINRLHRQSGVTRTSSGSSSLHRPPGRSLTDACRRRQVDNRTRLCRADSPTAESLQKYTAELVSDGAVKDEVNSAVDVDKQVAHVRKNDVCRCSLDVRRVYRVRHIVRQRRYLQNRQCASIVNYFSATPTGTYRSLGRLEFYGNEWGEMQACRGYGYPWIYPWILRWHNTITLNLCKIPASYKLLTNCTFLIIICFNYLLLCIFITISERNACVMVVLI